MKLALQTSRTLEDFENLLKSIPKPMGSDANFGGIDAFGGAAFYETGNFHFKKFDAGFPLTSVAIPTLISAGNKLLLAVTLDKNFRSPICTAALKFKEECFPITYDRGTNYINLSVSYQSAKKWLLGSLNAPLFIHLYIYLFAFF
jgi:hypothetical protein